ncbi:MAG TPA: amidohydrolase family protein [bacterium]|nr:amidohydrolase family protein [bacterium]
MAPAAPEWLIVRASRLLDGTGRPPLSDSTVVVHRGCIHHIFAGPAPRGDWPPGTPVLDFPGHTLLPGLIDAHVHLVLPGDGTPFEESVRETDGVLLASAMHNARTALRAGITTLRDCGGMRDTTLDLRRAQRLGYAVIPRLHLCRCPVTITGGHCWYFGGEADGPEGMRQMVRRLVKAGVDYIKIMASGGGTLGTYSSRPSYTVEELRAAVDEAHRLHRRVGIHCTCAEATRNAVAAGTDHIEHALFLTDEGGRQEFDAGVADAVAQRDVAVTSTLCVGRFLVDALSARERTTPEERSAVERWRRMNEANLDNARRMRRAGVRYVAGTDAGWRFTPFDGLATELELLREAGATPAEAILAATSAAAAAMGVAGEVGALREGLHADMIAVAGDPLENLAVLRRPAMVMLGGAPVIRNGGEDARA